METQIFYIMKNDVKDHKRPLMYIPKSLKHIRLWTDFDENLYEC